MNAFLAELFRERGLEARLEPAGVFLPRTRIRAEASLVAQHPSSLSLALEVRLVLGPGPALCESFPGVGATREAAIADAQQAFVRSAFPVLLAAFFGVEGEGATREEWILGGERRTVTIGDVAVRGRMPGRGEAAHAAFRIFERGLKAERFPEGAHWVRFYFAQSDGRSLACEVLRDNLPLEELQSELAAFDWPRADAFYSLRVFLVVQDRSAAPPTLLS